MDRSDIQRSKPEYVIRMKKRMVVMMAVLAVGAASAAEHELAPALVVRTCNEGHGGRTAVGGHWSDHGKTRGNQTWLRFRIPTFPGERITGAALNIGPVTQYNLPWDAGVQVHYVAADEWSREDLTKAQGAIGPRKGNRNASDKGKTPTGRISTDVLDWLQLPGEGQGAELSIRLSHSGGGLRGWHVQEPTSLTLTTKALMTFGPPASAPAGPGGLAVRSSLGTVFAEEPPEPERDPMITLSAARRESESAQVVVIAGTAAKQVSAVTAEPLVAVDGRAEIPAGQTRVELVGYVTVEEPSWRGWKRAGCPGRMFTRPTLCGRPPQAMWRSAIGARTNSTPCTGR